VNDDAARKHPWIESLRQQVRIVMIGLGVVVVPLVVAGNAVDQLRKVVHKALVAIEPRVDELGGTTVTVIILLALLLCAWVVGRIMTLTELGQRILAWEKRVFSTRSSVMKKQASREEAAEEAAARAASPGHAGLAHIQGGWQPCVIYGASEGSLTSVFVPQLPAAETGSLYVLEADRVHPLDVPLAEFRATLTKYGHGGTQWAAALAADDLATPES